MPVPDEAQLARAAQGLERELAASLPGFAVTVARSRRTQDPVDLYRAGKEALLAANVAEAEGLALLAFEDTGAYRLLLPAMSEDPGELERFYEETLAPLAAYDEQYETDLVATLRPIWRTTATWRRPRPSCSPTATPFATGWSGCGSCAVTTSPRARGARG